MFYYGCKNTKFSGMRFWNFFANNSLFKTPNLHVHRAFFFCYFREIA